LYEQLLKYSILRRRQPLPKYRRFLFGQIDFDARLIGIVGARGAGKTTLALQYLESLSAEEDELLYVSCDHPALAAPSLLEVADEASKYGVKTLVIDEIHKKENFAVDLKNIYDFLDIRVIFTGSSAIHLERSRTDLSRRALLYRLPELSFREYLELNTGERFRACPLEKILTEHIKLSSEILRRVKPLKHFGHYLEYGAYPYFAEGPASYPQRLLQILNETLRDDIATVYGVKLHHMSALQRVLEALCRSEPYEINYEKIAAAAEISRHTLKQYLYYLEEGSLTRRIGGEARGNRYIAKPDKLYLHNTNLFGILCPRPKPGTVRETFFAQSLGYAHELKYPPRGDFLIDGIHTVEVGGPDKGFAQLEDRSNAYVAADGIETGFGRKIPLWLFGFLY
jgi:predicted AAA+ superfamily ATPase